jgi:hypothetical protein
MVIKMIVSRWPMCLSFLPDGEPQMKGVDNKTNNNEIGGRLRVQSGASGPAGPAGRRRRDGADTAVRTTNLKGQRRFLVEREATIGL